MRFVIFGAGAVGGLTGGGLARAGFDVTLVGRPRHVEAIQNQGGLRLHGWEESWLQPIRAVPDLSDCQPVDEAVLVLGVKSYDTVAALYALAQIYPETTPILCLQNGVTNEKLAARRFHHVYGGVFKITASMLEPGEVIYRRLGQIVVGLHPQGTDETSAGIVDALCRAGFRGELSENITAERWHKLLINLNSATHAIVKTTQENYRDMARIRAAVVREGHEVLTAEGIGHEPTAPGSETMSEMLEKLEKSGPPSADPKHFMVYNGTWQNLQFRPGPLENGLYHEPIIELGKTHSIPTPYNRAVWKLLQESHRKELGPEAFSTGDIDTAARSFE